MNILNREQFLHHLHPDNNYLVNRTEDKTVEIVEEAPEVLEGTIEEENSNLIVEDKRKVGSRNPNVPDFLRKTIAIVANEPGSKQKEIAETFGVGQPVVSKSKNGIITYNNGKDAELSKVVDSQKKANEAKREKIEDAALELTLQALKLTDVDDLSCLNPKDRIATAAQAAKIVDSIRDKKEQVNDNRVQFIIMSPQVRQDVNYDTIDV